MTERRRDAIARNDSSETPSVGLGDSAVVGVGVAVAGGSVVGEGTVPASGDGDGVLVGDEGISGLFTVSVFGVSDGEGSGVGVFSGNAVGASLT